MFYSVLLPQRDAGDQVRRQLPELCRTLNALGKAHEIVCVDAGSRMSTLRLLQALMMEHAALRVLSMAEPCGLSAALGAGIEAARGNIIIAVEAGGRYPACGIADLLHHLSRADLVVGQRRLNRIGKTWQRIARFPRMLTVGLESKDPECLFWAARREAIEGLPMSRGMYRYLATLVARRGYRVTETYIEHRAGSVSLQDGWPNPGDLLTAWWLGRRLQWPQYDELTLDEAGAETERNWRKSA